MIDGRGKARVTDFGVAVVAKELLGREAASGTLAYMAPEQLKGKEVTQKSDIYSLGLMLYELFTGKPVYSSDNLHDLMKLHESSTPTSPSSHISNIDPLVEKVILRCLEKDPKDRPASAIQVAAALPGGDPLAAARAAGETPSPAMVAASGEKTGLRPVIGVACMAAIVIGTIITAYLHRRVDVIERAPFENSPEILARKARDITAQLGYPERPFDNAYGLLHDNSFLHYIEENDPSRDGWERIRFGRGQSIIFWYRESPYLLAPLFRSNWSVTESDPPRDKYGLVNVYLDPTGRLEGFLARPPAIETQTSAEASPKEPNWKVLFQLAGLEMSRFVPTDSEWIPISAFDTRAAWNGTLSEMEDIPVRVEAAGYRGKVVTFRVYYPWTKPPTPAIRWDWNWLVQQALFALVALGAALLARHNYKQRKGDRRGAARLASFIFVTAMAHWRRIC